MTDVGGEKRALSLGTRLLAVSALFTLVALVLTFALMWAVLQRFVTGQIDQRLDNKIIGLASQTSAAPDGSIALVGAADGPPFDRPRHKAFWWVEGPRNAIHSGWLKPGDFVPPTAKELAELPPPPVPPQRVGDEPLDVGEKDRPQTIEGSGLHGVALHVRAARRLIGTTSVTIFVAAPDASIAGPVREAMRTVGLGMAALGLVLLGAAFAQVRLGLRPLARLRAQVASVRAGTAETVPPDQPREILPLVMELNDLLAQNAANLVRARRHVANLAHGLKTPLATLSLTVDRLEGEERAPLRDLVGMIERRIRHHLGRARSAVLAGPNRSQAPLAARLRDLTDALQRIHADKSVALTLVCPGMLVAACEPQDVDEILGNLLDNAFKYTRSRVGCEVRDDGRRVIVSISDDGPGLDADEIERVMHPGQRLDEVVPGFGFGLPIARELAELYGGSLVLARRDVGLVVTLTLPKA